MNCYPDTLMTKTIHSSGQRALVATLTEARKAAGISQSELAERLHCHQSMIARIESGERRIDVVELIVITRAVGIDAAKVVASVSAAVDDDLRL